MTISWPNNTKSQIDEMRAAIGRATYWYKVESSTACPICNLDPVTNTSTDSFCPVCSGIYWIETISVTTISGHVTWGQVDDLGWSSGGQYYEGDCRVQIEYTPENDLIVDSALYTVIDGKIMQKNTKIYRGFQPINRIIITFIEKE